MIKGRVLTGFYLARSEKEGHLVIAAYVRCNGDDRYRNLFGHDEAMRVFPRAGRTLLTDDMGL